VRPARGAVALDQCAARELAETEIMIWFCKARELPPTTPSAARPARADNLRNMARMTQKLGLEAAPASWPTGVSLLAQAVDACQRCDAADLCSEWLARAPDAIAVPPSFCANAEAFTQAKQARG
jgi:hypothetical protein